MIIPEPKNGIGSFEQCPRFPNVLFGKSYQKFMRSMKGSRPSTLKRYSVCVAEFLIYHQSNTEDFYAWILEEKKRYADGRDFKEYFEDVLTNYYDHLLTREEKPLKFTSVVGYVKAVNHFLRGNGEGIGYSYKPSILENDEYEKKVLIDGSRKFSREDIQFLMESTANRQYKAIMMILKDSGLRSGDVGRLQYKHIREALQDPAPEFITFEIMPDKNKGKSNIYANVVLGYDAIKYLRAWTVHKKKLFEKREAYEIMMSQKGRYRHEVRQYEYTENDEDYVFCKTETKMAYEKGNGDKAVPTHSFGDRLGHQSVTQMMLNLKKPYKDQFKKKSAHSFRKTHSTGLTAGDVPERWINKMQGRKGTGTQGVYQKPDPEELIAAYKKGYHKIALVKPESQEITELKHTLDAILLVLSSGSISAEQKRMITNSLPKEMREKARAHAQPTLA